MLAAMQYHLTILTGASRGLGAAMAEQLLKHGHRLVTLSRHTASLWVVLGADLEQWEMDLADPAPAAARLAAWLAAQQANVRSFTLVMQHEPRWRSDVQTPAATALDIALAEPSRDAEHLQIGRASCRERV